MLAWFKAAAVRGMGLSKDEREAGWPARFYVNRLAILQSPDDVKLQRVINAALLAACRDGRLVHVKTTIKARQTLSDAHLFRRIPLGSDEWRERGFLCGTMQERVYTPGKIPLNPAEDRVAYEVDPAAFSQWLKANRQVPSEHIAAWLDATRIRIITPPVGWQLRSPHGLLRFDATPMGLLVRLADLVQWLMDGRHLPCATAVELVCDALSIEGAGAWLYLLDESRYAKQLPADHSFAYSPSLSFWETAPAQSPGDVGIAGAIKHMRSYWGGSASPGAGNWMGQHVLEPLAIRLDKAYELWGYGRPIEETHGAAPADGEKKDAEMIPATYVLPQVLRERVKRSRWSLDEKRTLRDAIEKAGPGGAAAAARELDITQARVSELLASLGKDLAETVWPAASTARKRA